MLKLDRTKPYSVVNGSIRGLEQNGVLFNNNGDPFYPDKEEMRLEEERKKAAEKAEKEKKEMERKKKLIAEKMNKPQRRRPGRPTKKKEVHRGTVLDEKKEMPEMEIPQPFDFSPGKDFNNEGK